MHRRIRIAALACLALAGVAGTDGADADPSPAPVREDRCGHVAELLAARRAAELGDQQAVLEHLRKADAILAHCLRDGESVPAGAPGEVGTG